MLIRAVQAQAGLAYADDTWSPISDITLDLIARRMGTLISHRNLGEGIQELGVPGYMGHLSSSSITDFRGVRGAWPYDMAWHIWSLASSSRKRAPRCVS
jgi:hypothetical protein